MRVTKEPHVRRQEIICTATALFESQGIKKTSMNEIAQRIGVAKGLIYYYFPSKEELVRAVIEEFIKGVDEELENIMSDGRLDFYSKLTAILRLYFNSIQSHPAIFSFSSENAGMFTLIRDRLSERAFFHARKWIATGIEGNILNIPYPEYMLKVIIRGLGDLYIEGVHNPDIHIKLIEQMLGLEEGKIGWKEKKD